MNLLWIYTLFSSINRREMLEKYHEVILWQKASTMCEMLQGQETLCAESPPIYLISTSV